MHICNNEHKGKKGKNSPRNHTFNEHHTSVNEKMASFTCIKKLGHRSPSQNGTPPGSHQKYHGTYIMKTLISGTLFWKGTYNWPTLIMMSF